MERLVSDSQSDTWLTIRSNAAARKRQGFNFLLWSMCRVDVALCEFATQHVVMTHAPKRCLNISQQAYEVIGKFARAHLDACLEACS